MNENTQVNHPMLKLFSVLVMWLGSLTWGERASMAALFYTLLLITDWFWKRLWKPFFLRRGWIKGRRRNYMDADSTDQAPL